MGYPAAPFAALAPHADGLAIDPMARIDPNASIGPDCVIRAGAYLCAGVVLERGTSVGANAVFVDLPGASTPVQTLVRAEAWIGPNATIHAGLTIGARAVVRPGAVVTRNVPPAAIVEGNPAAIVGYVGANDHVAAQVVQSTSAPRRPAVEQTPVRGVTLHNFPVIPDLRGSLTVGEFERQVPFTPQRYFMVFGVPSREIRGEHAHHECHQFLLCVHGSCAVVADDGENRVEVTLDAPNVGLYLPPMTWGIQYKYSPDAMLLVFASHHYDAADYIRDHGDYLALVPQFRAAQAAAQDTQAAA